MFLRNTAAAAAVVTSSPLLWVVFHLKQILFFLSLLMTPMKINHLQQRNDPQQSRALEDLSSLFHCSLQNIFFFDVCVCLRGTEFVPWVSVGCYRNERERERERVREFIFCLFTFCRWFAFKNRANKSVLFVIAFSSSFVLLLLLLLLLLSLSLPLLSFTVHFITVPFYSIQCVSCTRARALFYLLLLLLLPLLPLHLLQCVPAQHRQVLGKFKLIRF